MNDSAVVDIIDVVPNAIKVYADQIREGDSVLDIWGDPHKVARLVRFTRRVRVWREDGWPRTFDFNDEITIVPGDGDTSRNLDKVSSGSRQGWIETGRYSSEAEEREINPRYGDDEPDEPTLADADDAAALLAQDATR